MKNLSSKELHYISDVLSWELLAAKKCNLYITQEPAAPQANSLADAARAHVQNYNDMLGYLTQIKNSQGGGQN